MTNKEAIDMLTSIRDYLCNGNPIWKTKPIRDAVNMAIDALRKTEPTISKMEQVDKDINVRSKTEPQPNADQHVQRVEYVGNDGRCRCWKCKHFEEMHETPIASDGRYYTYVVCTASRCHYEPKDEPQTEYKKWETKPNADRPTANTTCVGVAVALIEDEPQTDEPYEYEIKALHKDYVEPYVKIEDEPQTDCDTCLYKDAYDEWEGDCDDCQDASNYEPQTDCAWGKHE